MAHIRMLVERPGKRKALLTTVAVNDAVMVSDLVEKLVKQWRYPPVDLYGQPVAYHLRSVARGHVLPKTLPLAQAGVGPDTRLVLECEATNYATVPIGSARAPQAPALDRRSVLMRAGMLSMFALTGLFSGVGVAMAQRYRARPLSSGSTVRVKPLTRVSTFSGHRDVVRQVAWSSTGQLASGADDGQLLVWRSEGTILQQIQHPASVAALAWSPAGQRLVTGSANQVRFFDAQTGVLLAARFAHKAPVTALVWSSLDGHPVISAAQDERALVWETQQYSVRSIFARHTTAITSLSVQAQGVVASSSQGGVVRIWQHDTAQEVHAFYQDAMTPMLTVAFDPTGVRLAVGGNDGQVRLWAKSLTCQQVVTTDQGARCADVPQRWTAHRGTIRALAWSPDGRSLATGGDDHHIAIWDMESIGTLAFIGQHDAPVLSVTWSPDGKRLAAASGSTVTIWQRP